MARLGSGFLSDQIALSCPIGADVRQSYLVEAEDLRARKQLSAHVIGAACLSNGIEVYPRIVGAPWDRAMAAGCRRRNLMG